MRPAPPLHAYRHIRIAAGSALLAVLCLVTVLSFIIISTMGLSMQHSGMQQTRMGLLRARQLAEMGVAVAVNPMIQPGDPALSASVSPVESFAAVVTTEESRLNLNRLLTQDQLPILERMFTSWGLSPAGAQGVAASLLDWTDADDLKIRPDSAERSDYEFLGFKDRPSNRPLASLDEVDLVARSEELRQVRPDWRSLFTLRGNGQLDVNEASAEVLAALTGASLINAQHLVSLRNGLDGLPHTQDDRVLTSLDEAVAMLGIAGPGAAQILPLLTLRGSTLRIESIGTAGDERAGLAVSVVRDGGGGARIAEWREFMLERRRS
ncbi:general secretion pathway protein GspK [Prosthecobacter sp.]|uniref:general secretion pathway protein GspK n=1 Tax=Prosthecobacter sp. TaxID=1965333 RepID=UPI003783B008